MKSVGVFEPVFKSYCLLIYDCSYETAIGYLNRKFKLEEKVREGKRSACMMSFDTAPFQVIWLRWPPKCAETTSILVHEVMHLATRICVPRNLPTYPYIDNLIMDEPLAYIAEYYTFEFLKKAVPSKQKHGSKKTKSRPKRVI